MDRICFERQRNKQGKRRWRLEEREHDWLVNPFDHLLIFQLEQQSRRETIITSITLVFFSLTTNNMYIFGWPGCQAFLAVISRGWATRGLEIFGVRTRPHSGHGFWNAGGYERRLGCPYHFCVRFPQRIPVYLLCGQYHLSICWWWCRLVDSPVCWSFSASFWAACCRWHRLASPLFL